MLEILTTPHKQDPLDWLRVPLVEEYIVPLYTHTTLDKHIHELIAVFLAYHALYLLSYFLSPRIWPAKFKTLSYKTRIDFHIHVVSLVQSVLILILIIPCFYDLDLAEDRVFGYTPYSGFVTTMALGYFLWDSVMSIWYVQYFGIGFLVHGIVSSAVFAIGLSPFISYYAAVFILFELSTPFLNLRWFGLKVPGLFSETFQLINNAVLILIFFFVRICYGFYQAFNLFSDFYVNYQDERFHTTGAIIIFTGNVVLDILNLYWFYRMVKVAYAILADMFTGKNIHDDAKKDI